MLNMLKTIINTSLLTIITLTSSHSVLAQSFKTEIIDNGVQIQLDNGLKIINRPESTPQNNEQNSAKMTINDSKNGKINVEIIKTPNANNLQLSNLQIIETSTKNTSLNVVITNVFAVDCSQSVPTGFITNPINMNGKINSANIINQPVYFDNKNPYSQLVSQVCKKY